jgi:hypothetical protein
MGQATAPCGVTMASPARCTACKMPLVGQYVTASSRPFHPACFACSKCRKLISGSFTTVGAQFVCVPCSTAGAPSCSGCGQKITEGGFLTVKGLSFHPQHFVCATCGTSLQSGLASTSGGVHVFESFGAKPRAMCGSCHAVATGCICFSCSKPIVGEHVVADNKKFHGRCWTCASCRCELVGTGYHRLLLLLRDALLSHMHFKSQRIAGAATAGPVAANATRGSLV